MNNLIEIFTDGACKGNPGPGGWGALLRTTLNRKQISGEEEVMQPELYEKQISGGEELTTNNRMELMAVIKALQALTRRSKVSVTTDSQYVKLGITQWINGWKKNGWKTSKNQAVKNKDLWEILDAEVEKHNIMWVWVKGHSGHYENDLVDQLATQAVKDLISESTFSH